MECGEGRQCSTTPVVRPILLLRWLLLLFVLIEVVVLVGLVKVVVVVEDVEVPVEVTVVEELKVELVADAEVVSAVHPMVKAANTGKAELSERLAAGKARPRRAMSTTETIAKQ